MRNSEIEEFRQLLIARVRDAAVSACEARLFPQAKYFGGTGSQFSISQSELRSMLSSRQVVGSPVRVLQNPGGEITYLRQVDMGQTIGFDKYAGAETSTLTVITDSAGNVESAFPGVLRMPK
jgi:hypothetical protein